MSEKFSEELLNEVEDVININEIPKEEELIPFVYDGRQFSLKIPKKIAEKAEISKNDYFKLQIKTQTHNGELRTYLVGELIQNEKNSSQE